VKREPGVAPQLTLDAKAHRGALWSGVNMIVTKFAGIAITIVIVRIVSPHDFGVFAAALIVHTIVSSFAELGVSSCVARRDLKLEDTAPTVAAISLITGLLLAVIVFGLGQIASILGAPDAEGPIQVLSLCIPSSLIAVPTAMMTEIPSGPPLPATLISFVPANGLLILLALGGDGAMAFAWSRVVGLVCVGLVIVATPQRFFWPRIDRARLVPILKFGLPLAGANLINYTVLNADFAFIGRLLGPAVLGMYVLAFNVASWSTSVMGSTINGVAMTAFSESGTDYAVLRERLTRWARLTALVACPLATMTTVLSSDIVIGLYGEQWAEAGHIVAILALYGGVFTTSLLLSNLLVAKGQSWRVLLIQVIWLVTLVPAIWFGVSVFGVLGAAWANVVIILFIVMPLYITALRPVIPNFSALLFRATGGPLLAAIAAAGAAFLVMLPVTGTWWRIGLATIAGGTVYLAVALPLARGVIGAAGAARFTRYFAIHDSIVARLLPRSRRRVT
jgi:PST family polysaccharide transporter